MNIPLFLAQTAELTPVELTRFFDGFDPSQRFVLTIIGIGCFAVVVISITTVAVNVLHRIKERQIDADLKRDMLDRGMTADEIQKVIEAAPQSGVDRWLGSWCKKK